MVNNYDDRDVKNGQNTFQPLILTVMRLVVMIFHYYSLISSPLVSNESLFPCSPEHQVGKTSRHKSHAIHHVH